MSIVKDKGFVKKALLERVRRAREQDEKIDCSILQLFGEHYEVLLSDIAVLVKELKEEDKIRKDELNLRCIEL